jgi:aminoglycoside phosphotransferase family enzyme/predicted kinase
MTPDDDARGIGGDPVADFAEPIPPLIRSLLDPAAYPIPAEKVSLVQTHISYIFLVGTRAYKVKKPVNLGFLDYSTRDLREHFCRREVELNRRLAPELYLGVEPIVATSQGIRVGGDGEPVEWCVVMQRLPEEQLLSTRLSAGDVTPDQITAVARQVANFHRVAQTGGEIDIFGQPATIRVNTEENFTQLAPYVGRTVSANHLARIRAFTEAFLLQNRPLCARRIADHRIRDCHGDLHAGSICLADEIQIFDCIEFNDRFRYSDVAAEVAFLAMDLEHFGRSDLAWHFVDAYRQAAGDGIPDDLLAFYACYRAVVRAKVESFKLDEPGFTADERATTRERASVYVDLALTHTGVTARPALVLTSGLVGSGKTTVARELAHRFALVYLSSDVTRKHLVGLDPTEHRYEAFGEGIYADDLSRRTYAALLAEATTWLSRGISVIVDASFKHQAERDLARELAEDRGVRLVVLECVCPEEELHRRLDQRRLTPGEASDARWELFARQKGDFDLWKEIDQAEHVVVRTDQALAHCVEQVRPRLLIAPRGFGLDCPLYVSWCGQLPPDALHSPADVRTSS